MNKKNSLSNKNYVNLKGIIYNLIKNSDGVKSSIVVLMIAYWLQDVMFFGNFSKFTSDVPNFVNNISSKTILAIIAPYMIGEMLFYINGIIISNTIPKMEIKLVDKLRSETFRSLQTTKSKINVNEFIMNLKKVLDSESLYYLFVTSILPTTLITIGLIYHFMKANKQAGVCVMIVVMIFFYVVLKICKKTVEESYKNEDVLNVHYDNIHDVMTNADLVITANAEKKETANFNESNKKVVDAYTTSETTAAEHTLYLRMLSLLFVLFIDSLAIILYSKKLITMDIVTSICITSIVFLRYFNSLAGRIRNNAGQLGRFNEISDYFKTFKINESDEKLKEMKLTNGNIEFRNISLTIADRNIIDNFNFKVKGGTTVGIVGDIGKGKTSLLKILSGLIEYEGNVFIDDQNLRNCSYESIMKHLVYIPQYPKMFNKNIYYNISYGTNKSEQEVSKFIRETGFEEYFKVFTNGLQTPVGKDGSNLSGGQKQLIAIIRSLLQNKSVFLFDEPTSSLDQNTKNMVMGIIKKIKHKTILIVTHDKYLNPLFDEYIHMK